VTVQDCFDLCEHSREFFKGKSHWGYNPLEMSLSTLNNGLPDTAKMGGFLGDESPHNLVGTAEI